MNHILLKEWSAGFIWLLSIVFLASIPDQQDFHLILPALIGSFSAYGYLCYMGQGRFLKYGIVLAVLARILVIPVFPNLSDDIYRFVWDGRLWHLGVHPFSVLPSDIMGAYDLLPDSLFAQLNSKEYFTIYPPFAQCIFWIATIYPSLNFMTEAIIMKVIHCSFDIGTLVLLFRLLARFNLPQERILLYALNPLIIIELIANLHHEGIIIFFILLTIYLIDVKQFFFAGFAMAAAIATKIIPVIFCPIIFFYLKGKNRWLFTITVTVITALLFSPILYKANILVNLGTSADLYLRKFEFNAGIYYLLREIGYIVKGYNTIHILGPMLMSISVITIGYISFSIIKRKDKIAQLPILIMWSYLAYALLSITLHPWYIAILIPLCIFSNFRTPIVWSALIMLTYANYSFNPYHEVMMIVLFEYAIVFFLMTVEVKRYGWLSSKNLQ